MASPTARPCQLSSSTRSQPRAFQAGRGLQGARRGGGRGCLGWGWMRRQIRKPPGGWALPYPPLCPPIAPTRPGLTMW